MNFGMLRGLLLATTILTGHSACYAIDRAPGTASNVDSYGISTKNYYAEFSEVESGLDPSEFGCLVACATIHWDCTGKGWFSRTMTLYGDAMPWNLDATMCAAIKKLDEGGWTDITCRVDTDGDGGADPTPYQPNCGSNPA